MGEELIVRPKTLKIRVPITIKDLAVEMKLKASQLISNLFMKGVVLTLNDYIDDETTIQLLGTILIAKSPSIPAKKSGLKSLIRPSNKKSLKPLRIN